MSANLYLLCVSLICCSIFCDALPNREIGYYTIVAPGTLRSNSLYRVSISLSNFHQSCWFNISIDPQQRRLPEFVETVEVVPGTTKLVNIQMPALNYGHAKIEVLGYRGIIAREVGQLIVEDRNYTVYIQTDKAKYKPGELVLFRVICIDRLTQPAKVNEDLVVEIYDGRRNLIKNLPKVELVQGVFKGDLQLSEYAVLGDWRIEVKANSLTIQEKIFQVARYVLPTFSVDIMTKKNVALDEGKIIMTVKASYTYGGPVKGNLTIYLSVKEKISQITKEINGETTIILDFKTDLNISGSMSVRHTIALFTLNATTIVHDSLTGQYALTQTSVLIHSHPYKFRIDAPKSFESKNLVNVTITLTDLQNNPIRDATNPVAIIIEARDFEKVWDFEVPASIIKTVYLDDNGVGVISFNLTDKNVRGYKLHAEYLEWISQSEIIQRNDGNTFSLDILTESPEVGKEIAIQLKSMDPIDYYAYEVISRGNIILSGYIAVAANETTHILRFDASYEMVPKAIIFIHRVKNRIFDSRLKEVYIKRTFQNSITIDTDDEVKPGSPVSVNVTTDEGSYVGLMGVDQKLLLDLDTNNDLTEDYVYTKLRNYDAVNMNTVRFPGIEAGLITFSNAHNRIGNVIGKPLPSFIPSIASRFPDEEEYPLPETFDEPSIELPRIRKLFAESWLFKDFIRTPVEGLQFQETIPDTITSWAITGFSLNPKTGLSLTRNVTTLKVFQAFFISMDLPSLVKEGEVIEVPVYVFNYKDENLLTDVTIFKQSDDIELLDRESFKANGLPSQTITKSIPAQGSVKVVFVLRPRKSGDYKMTVNAISPIASDAVQKTLKVESEGIPYSVSQTYLVQFHEESEQEDEMFVKIPKNYVQGSESFHLSVVGDIFGPLTRSLHSLVRVPYGNGEDNIKYFSSNMLVLKYLKVFNHSNPNLESKIKLHLELGYQTQLSFKHLDGSFSLFERSSGTKGEVRLTAYAMWGLQQAKSFIQIDSRVINRGLGYLKSKQAENGCFGSGKGIEEDVALTALTLLSFLVDHENQDKFKGVITKGLQYLYENLDDLEQSAPIVMSTYALVLGQHEKSRELLGKLTSHAALTGKQIMWTKPDTLQSILETTAGSFMNLLESENRPVHNLLIIVKSLISSGSGDATSNNIIALEAMIQFARDMDFGKKDLNINFSDGHGVSGDLQVDQDNAQVLQTVELSKTARKIHLKTKGIGFAIVNIKYRYNLVLENQSWSMYQTSIAVKESSETNIILDVCVSLRLPGRPSNLTVMEVNLQTGSTFDEETFDEIQAINDRVKFIQGNRYQGSVLVYIENITNSETCIKLGVLKTFNVFNAKPISVVVYDVSKEDQKSVSFHEIELSKAKNSTM